MRGQGRVYRPVIGRIGSEPDMREAPAFAGLTRAIEVSDSAGRLHGRIVWLASEANEDFEHALLGFCKVVIGGFQGTPTGGAA